MGYSRKSQRCSYGVDALSRALEELRNGSSYHGVSKKYSIPRRTLQRHMKGQVRSPGNVALGRFRITIPQDVEDELVAHAIEMQQRFYGITPVDMRRLAYQLV